MKWRIHLKLISVRGMTRSGSSLHDALTNGMQNVKHLKLISVRCHHSSLHDAPMNGMQNVKHSLDSTN